MAGFEVITYGRFWVITEVTITNALLRSGSLGGHRGCLLDCWF
jgi:hypothetical protein